MAILLSSGASAILAEPGGEASSANLAPRFGTANAASYEITPLDFSPIDSTIHYLEWVVQGGSSLSTSTPYGAFYAAPEIQSGALLVGLNVYYCNNNPPGGDDFLVFLEDLDSSGNFLGVIGSVTAHANDGCTSQSVDLTGQNYTVNNISNRLLVWTIFGPNPNPQDDLTAYVDHVTLTYRLQLSRAPLTPTFGDVPLTDPGYQYIEALSASGVTAGCGGGNFCPDQSVTRRQMAVFLSRALGLAYGFGTIETNVQVPEWKFRAVADSVLYEDTGPPQLSRYAISAPVAPWFASAVGLPPGAVLDEVEFDFCDDRPSNSAPIYFSVLGNGAYIVNLQSVPGAGCGSVSASNVGYTADDNKLIATIQVGGPYADYDSRGRFQGARFTYHLQVSPPPATATFGDVPTSDVAFAYVEALAASGITGG
ncbi:MAG TPA: S-layer homology domain-containing protein, partial [Thermoanaerobaculia bacterium]|nr:S-layer homology domain-containing protein [Thermoanaerobaculia bacterium]